MYTDRGELGLHDVQWYNIYKPINVYSGEKYNNIKLYTYEYRRECIVTESGESLLKWTWFICSLKYGRPPPRRRVNP